MITFLPGDNRETLRTLADNSVDSVVCDPPYELGFMGRAWDASGIAYQVALWREVYRVLKPGGHLVAFGGTRTSHRLTCAIEDAGFEIRDSLHWLYGSGFPKSHDVSKALDKAAGAERAVIGTAADFARDGHKRNPAKHASRPTQQIPAGDRWALPVTAPATDLAAQWAGWGTALKPAHEPVVLARKPLAGTVAATVAQWGTGGINVDACRVAASPDDRALMEWRSGGAHNENIWQGPARSRAVGERFTSDPAGRWPPNVLLTHSAACNGHCAPDCPVAALDRQSGVSKSTGGSGPASKNWRGDGHTVGANLAGATGGLGDTGGASRFFPVLPWDPATDVPFAYVPKASRAERNAGCAGLPEGDAPGSKRSTPAEGRQSALGQPRANHHPCVKPVALMRWLVRLVTPPGGTVLDPFMGSGSTGVACVHLGFDFIGCEQDPDYLAIAQARIAHAQAQQPPAVQVALLEMAV